MTAKTKKRSPLEPTELTEYSTASQLAQIFRHEESRLVASMEVFEEAMQSLASHFATGSGGNGFAAPQIYLGGDRYNFDARGRDEFRQTIKQLAWRYLVKKLGVEAIMSSSEADKLDRGLYDKSEAASLPEITPETILDVLNGYFESANDLLVDLIREEFRWIRPWREDGYKTNSAFKVNRKVIINAVERWYSGGFHATSYAKPHLRSLNNIFRMLDGKGPSELNDGELNAAIQASRDEDGAGETEYFTFRCFKNGNLHLTFRRQDLLDRFNEIGGEGNLGR